MARLMNKGQPAMVKNDFDFVSSCIDSDSFTTCVSKRFMISKLHYLGAIDELLAYGRKRCVKKLCLSSSVEV